MPLESATYLFDLVPTNPPGTDGVSQGDDHLRLIKAVLQNTFPNIVAQELPGTSGSILAQAVQYSYAPPGYSNGMTISFLANLPSAGPTTISVNGLPPVPIHAAGQPLSGNEIQPGFIYTLMYLNGAFEMVSTNSVDLGELVYSFNGRTGAVTLTNADVTAAGGAVLNSPAFTGTPTAPTPAYTVNDNTLATAQFVNGVVNISRTNSVIQFNGRVGVITLSLADVTGAGGAPINAPAFTGGASVSGQLVLNNGGTTGTPLPGDNSTQIANTAFVQNALGLYLPLTGGTVTGALIVNGGSTFNNPLTLTSQTSNSSILTLVKMTNSIASIIQGNRASNLQRWVINICNSDPESSGNVGTNFQIGRFADAGAFIDFPITISRQTGIVAFSQSPTAPSPPPGDNSNSLATTAFVDAAVSGGGSFLPITGGTLTGQLFGTVASFQHYTAADGTSVPAVINGPVPGDNSNNLATTSWIHASYAPLASPALTGTPTAPTPAQADNSTHLATTAYINTALSNLRWNGTFA